MKAQKFDLPKLDVANKINNSTGKRGLATMIGKLSSTIENKAVYSPKSS
jgi:hypothetical protein